jgi:methyl-accepting chemotaxis protein
MNVKKKIALFPAMLVIALALEGAIAYLGFKNLNSSIDQIYNALTASQSISSVANTVISIQGNVFKLITWKVSDYPEAKVTKLAESINKSIKDLDALVKQKEQNAASEMEKESFRRIMPELSKYSKQVADAVDMASVDVAAASSYVGSVDKEFDFITAEVAKFEQNSANAHQAAENGYANTMRSSAVVLLILVLSAAGLGMIISLSIIKPITKVATGLSEGADRVAAASQQLESSSRRLAEGASEQAASLEETSSSLEEMASMTRHNAENAGQADKLVQETNKVVDIASRSMTELTDSMKDISRAGEETFKIIKTIDEIAFQTNLLALNAAVEAARAGEAGAGFAVVADEVRNLALRAAEAAKNTSVLIEGTIKKVKEGSDLVSRSNSAFSEVTKSILGAGGLVGEISSASSEQAHGIDQLNKATAEMDKVVQENAANAEESASASQEMSAQAEQMKGFVGDLAAMIGGGEKGGKQKSRTSSGRKAACG